MTFTLINASGTVLWLYFFFPVKNDNIIKLFFVYFNAIHTGLACLLTAFSFHLHIDYVQYTLRWEFESHAISDFVPIWICSCYFTRLLSYNYCYSSSIVKLRERSWFSLDWWPLKSVGYKGDLIFSIISSRYLVEKKIFL